MPLKHVASQRAGTQVVVPERAHGDPHRGEVSTALPLSSRFRSHDDEADESAGCPGRTMRYPASETDITDR